MEYTNLMMNIFCTKSIKYHIFTIYLFINMFLLFIPYLRANDTELFANQLYKERDYFRAITEYKRNRYFSDDENEKWISTVRIAESYWLSQKYESSLEFIFNMNNEQNDVTKKVWTLSTIALNYYGMKLFPNAKLYLNEAISINDNSSPLPYMYRSIINLEGGDTASAYLDLMTIKSQKWNVYSDQIDSVLNSAFDTINKMQNLQKKSEVLSAGFSSIVPGLGQLYSGHWFDAIQALSMIGSFALASYGVYFYEKSNGGPYIYTGVLSAITLSFHISNIYGAYKTAGYFNQKQKEDALQPLRSQIFSLPTLGESYYPVR